MTKHRIAVIVAGIDQSYQSAILEGMRTSASGCGLDISVFASFSGTMGNPRHDTGEFNIFRLPDFSDFDGAVLLTNTIDYPPVVSDIITRIRQAKIPAVCIDNDIPDMLYIGIDNRTAMRRITEHFIKVHGFTDICYISGPADNPESADRLGAFLDVMKEHGLSVDDESIYYGDFRGPSGAAAAEHFLAVREKMPQALICANDVMAATAINRLAEAGYKVPGDIAVSGFDNTYSRHNYQVELTTVDRPLTLSGSLACKMLRDYFAKTLSGRSVVLDMSTLFAESCGCSTASVSDIEEYRRLNYNNYRKFELSEHYLSDFNRLSCDLLGCNSFNEYIASLKGFVKQMDPGEFYFCLCENWDDETVVEPTSHQEVKIPDSYTESVITAVAYKNGEFLEGGTFPTSQLLPFSDADEPAGKFFYFVPLHFGERCLGYMAIRDCKVPLHNTVFQNWCISISNSLENIRKLINMDFAVRRLSRLYTRDTFSGIYNRNGFVEATAELYRKCAEEHREIMLMFIDLDGLKVINDTYGHSVGDNAISDIAEILCDTCVNNEIFCRFGGDEFIIFSADSSDLMAKKLTKQIGDAINSINESGVNPYELSASTGYVIAVPEPDEDLFNFVTAADKKMYIEKRKKKLSRYLKS